MDPIDLFSSAQKYYYDNIYDNACEYYHKLLTIADGYHQEKYIACINLYNIYKFTNQEKMGLAYLVESYKYDNNKIEGIYLLIKYYVELNEYNIALMYYSLIQKNDIDEILAAYIIICALKTDNLTLAINIFTKMNADQNILNIILSIDKFNIYLDELVKHNFDLKTQFTQIECINSKKILFFTGWCDRKWNLTYSLTNALGGSETAVAYLSKYFPKDYEIYIVGEVEEEEIDNIKYINNINAPNLIRNNAFHTIIVSRFLAFFEIYPYFSTNNLFIWVHDKTLLSYNSKLDQNDILTKWSHRITKCICQTEWHKQICEDLYGSLKNKIVCINNGIKLDLFIDNNISKVTNRFIYTSCPTRGLTRLLELWPNISNLFYKAELKIATYNNYPRDEEELKQLEIINSTNNIEFLGKLSPENLYNLMASSEYWLYPSTFEETSCITAMEMLYNNVICLYYPIAGLTSTLGDYGIQIEKNNELQPLIELSDQKKELLRLIGNNYARTCTWSERYKLWDDLIFKQSNNNYIKIINLKKREDRKMIIYDQIIKENIANYEFFEAINGQELLLSNNLFKLFERNNFLYRKGIIGCALSHITLWEKLINDNRNNYYVIFEDDIKLTSNFKEKLDYCLLQFEKEDMEYLYLGDFYSNKKLNEDISLLKTEPFTYNANGLGGAFAYIISKKAALKIINYFKNTSIKCAIDDPFCYNCIINYHVLNEYIVSAELVESYLNCKTNNIDSDIQSTDNVFDFSNIKSSIKQIKIGFYNFEYPIDFIVNLINEYGNNINVIIGNDNPNIIIYSDPNVILPKNIRKIFFSNKTNIIDPNADYNMVQTNNSLVNTKLPSWFCYNKIINKILFGKRVKFTGSYIISYHGILDERFRNIELHDSNKKYKFSIIFDEPINYYKYLYLFLDGTIPILWHDLNELNSNSYINAFDFNTVDELINYISKVDNDENLYNTYFTEPLFSKYWTNVFNNPNGTFFKNLVDNIVNFTKPNIKIVNLKRRPDRKELMKKQMLYHNIDNYEFYDAVDGSELIETYELQKMFERNDFNYKKGIIGCALSHINIWTQLINDDKNNYYVVLEDDIKLCDNFKQKLEFCCNEFEKYNHIDHLRLGDYDKIKKINVDVNNLKVNINFDNCVSNVTFAYIISKKGAQKIINFINKCSIKSAIDNPHSYGNVIRYNSLNENIVDCLQINNLGSDILYDNQFLKFHNSRQKRHITIAFCDWWIREYCGGDFDYNNNFFINLLKTHGNNLDVTVVSPNENPDVLFYSIFGNSHLNYNCYKVFYSGEPYGVQPDANYNITFDLTSDINTRLPLWVCYMDYKLLTRTEPEKREKFCSFIASGPGLTNNRSIFVEKLSKYKKVDCGGNYLNNIGGPIPLGINCSGKTEHNKQYKFALAFESKDSYGYCTEKLCDVFKSGCLPIYWGNHSVILDFNPKTFINANDFKDFDELIEYIIKVDNDNELYASYFKEQIFTDYWLNIFNDSNQCFFKNLADNIIINKKITIGFHDYSLSERGTSIALYDYAYYNQQMYNNNSIIFFNKNSPQNNKEVIEKFTKYFKCYAYDNIDELDDIIISEQINYFYNINNGVAHENRLVRNCPNLIHAVFTVDPYGDKYATVSKYLADKHKKYDVQYVPHMINLPECNKNMRNELNIPDDAIVLGRHGGYYQFDITIVHTVIKEFLKRNQNVYFLFVNTNNFYSHPRIIYLNQIIDLYQKVKFINTCDAMIHARSDGETFGLSIGEFSILNKPIITCVSFNENAHITELGDKAIIYNTGEELFNILCNIKEIINSKDNWRAYTEYKPDIVMKKFMNVFINNPITLNKNILDTKYYTMTTNHNFNNGDVKEITLVTAFFDIDRGNWTEKSRSVDNYLDSFLNYLNVDYKMIVFIDDRYIDKILNNQKNKQFIPINRKWLNNNIWAWAQLARDRKIMESQYYRNLVGNSINPENNYSEYNIINHSKIDFINYAINNNLTTDFICWVDFGYHFSILKNIETLFPRNILDITKFNTNKINFCVRNKLSINDYNFIYTLQNAPEKFTGSFFGGPKDLLIQFNELYHKALNELYINGITDDDQHVYLRCFFKNSELFELFISETEWPNALKYFEKPFNRFNFIKNHININNGVFVEIGTDTGKLSDFILSCNPTCTLYCIDPYLKYDDYVDSINNVTGDDLYNETKNKLINKHGNRVKFIRKFSHDAINDVPDNLDFVYIDGNHKYKYVYEDICDWYVKTKSGGILIGDDAVDTDNSRRNNENDVHIEWLPGCYGDYGVIKAFDDFIATNNCKGQLISNQYILIKN